MAYYTTSGFAVCLRPEEALDALVAKIGRWPDCDMLVLPMATVRGVASSPPGGYAFGSVSFPARMRFRLSNRYSSGESMRVLPIAGF